MHFVAYRLNLVRGENENETTSMILNAICLGVGVEPPCAYDVGAFIMHGKDTAMIEIEFASCYNSNGKQERHIKTTIQRHIERHESSEKGHGHVVSTFYINGSESTVLAVREIVCTTYEIEIDKLCIFLPKVEVGSISGLNDQDNQFYNKNYLELIEKEETIHSDIFDVEHGFGLLEISEAQIEEEQSDLLRKQKLKLLYNASRKKYEEKIRNVKTIHRDAIAPLEENRQPVETMHKELQAKSQELDGHCQPTVFKMNDEGARRRENVLQKAHGEQHKQLLQNTADNAGIAINITNSRTANRPARLVLCIN